MGSSQTYGKKKLNTEVDRLTCRKSKVRYGGLPTYGEHGKEKPTKNVANERLLVLC